MYFCNFPLAYRVDWRVAVIYCCTIVAVSENYCSVAVNIVIDRNLLLILLLMDYRHLSF